MSRKIIALCLIMCVLALSSCEDEGDLTDMGFVDPNTGIEYVEVAPMGLYPIRPEGELISVKAGDSKTTYYKVEFEDSSRFLCYEIEGNYFLVRSTDVKEPNISEFRPIAAQIYNSANKVCFDYFFADKEYIPESEWDDMTVGETALCRTVADAIMNGEAVDVPVTYDSMEPLFYFHFMSQDYPGLYYLVSFFGYNGRYFLSDSTMNKTVYCPNDIIVRLVSEG